MTAVVDARHETPVWVASGDADLMAVVTRPAQASDVGVILLTGGGWMPSTHRNRMYVDLARSLARMGCTVVRFDYPGVGDSTGVTPVFDSMRPHVDPVRAVAEMLGALGIRRVVLVGTCYGGRTALASSKFVPNLVGLVLSGVPVKDYGAADKSLTWHIRKAWSRETLKNLRARYPKYARIIRSRIRRLFRLAGSAGMLDPVSERYLQDLEGALARNIRILLLEGVRDKHHSSFVAALKGRLGAVLAAHPELVDVDTIDSELHGELHLESQDFTRDRVATFVESWLD